MTTKGSSAGLIGLVLTVVGVWWLAKSDALARWLAPVTPPAPGEAPEVPPTGTADIRFVSMVIKPSQVKVGQTAKVVVLATNFGDIEGERLFTVSCDGYQGRLRLTLGAGESRSFEHFVPTSEAKIYTVKVDGLSGTFEAI